MTEHGKYDVEQYGEVSCWGVLHGFPLVSWVNCLRARKIKFFFPFISLEITAKIAKSWPLRKHAFLKTPYTRSDKKN